MTTTFEQLSDKEKRIIAEGYVHQSRSMHKFNDEFECKGCDLLGYAMNILDELKDARLDPKDQLEIELDWMEQHS